MRGSSQLPGQCQWGSRGVAPLASPLKSPPSIFETLPLDIHRGRSGVRHQPPELAPAIGSASTLTGCVRPELVSTRRDFVRLGVINLVQANEKRPRIIFQTENLGAG